MDVALDQPVLVLNRLWQAAATVKSIMMPGLLEKAVQSGLRSLFVAGPQAERVSQRNDVLELHGGVLCADL